MGEEFLASTSNRTIQQTHVDWDTCHDAASGTILTNYGTPFYVILAGALLTASYFVHRGFLLFDTSSLSPNDVITSAKLRLYAYSVDKTSSEDYPNIIVTQGVHHDPVVVTDYGDQLPYTINGGQMNLDDMTVDQYNEIPLNANGIGWINKGGMTRLCIRQEMDVVDYVPPLGTNQLLFYSRQKGDSYAPILEVTVAGGGRSPISKMIKSNLI